MNNTYIVKRLRLLQYLTEKGFTEYTVVPDPTSTKGYNWFIFKTSPEFLDVLNQYFEAIKK